MMRSLSPASLLYLRAWSRFGALTILVGLAGIANAGIFGGQMLDYVATQYLSPLCIFAIIGSVATAIIRPELLKGALWTLVIACLLFAIIKTKDAISGYLIAT